MPVLAHLLQAADEHDTVSQQGSFKDHRGHEAHNQPPYLAHSGVPEAVGMKTCYLNRPILWQCFPRSHQPSSLRE